MLFAIAAEEAKLEVVALMSQWNPHPSHPSIVSREHWIANQLYRWMPSVDVVHINPGIFALCICWGCLRLFTLVGSWLPLGRAATLPPQTKTLPASPLEP